MKTTVFSETNNRVLLVYVSAPGVSCTRTLRVCFWIEEHEEEGKHGAFGADFAGNPSLRPDLMTGAFLEVGCLAGAEAVSLPRPCPVHPSRWMGLPLECDFGARRTGCLEDVAPLS